mmetsp:Transcript_30739/g.35268  ORF Transcript_30739/g.35268 Transcript_30739/m.35268 type:complete len:140 (+) Transcript_30739:71-490(+)|eukprot:CAMPEP_0170779576 /NCGR_PEP_ID=MMETSP0733-20121128/13061_1 /TAXON_ID=186038 /ORGANISM="Fragilariopsis kerguelensis, Strain L26-C5" /LENGTH=139 /DNA_ID=CAMNT_0011123201 /DNA_START=57 /DNA_END=476 /DNA_ORIENTATION=+
MMVQLLRPQSPSVRLIIITGCIYLPDFEDLSLVSFQEEEDDADDDDDDHSGIYYVNNIDNNDADADDDDDNNDDVEQYRQIGNDIDEISQIIIENMIERTVHPDVVDADDDEDGETFVNIIQNLIVDNNDDNHGVTEYE